MCDCARCEFDRANDGISMGNEITAIRSIFAPPAPDEQARAEVEANLNRPPVLRNACTELGLQLELEAEALEAIIALVERWSL